jgi:hypothetical protein
MAKCSSRMQLCRLLCEATRTSIAVQSDHWQRARGPHLLQSADRALREPTIPSASSRPPISPLTRPIKRINLPHAPARKRHRKQDRHAPLPPGPELLIPLRRNLHWHRRHFRQQPTAGLMVQFNRACRSRSTTLHPTPVAFTSNSQRLSSSGDRISSAKLLTTSG